MDKDRMIPFQSKLNDYIVFALTLLFEFPFNQIRIENDCYIGEFIQKQRQIILNIHT